MRIRLVLALAVFVALAAPALPAAAESDIFDRVDHGYADSDGVAHPLRRRSARAGR